MKTTPENITSLEPHQIFVFGSNTAGVHGKGAARTAEQLFGAKRGVAEGPTGRCFAIPTRIYLPKTPDNWKARFAAQPLTGIARSIARFLVYTDAHPELEFLVTKLGCGYAGYNPRDIKPMFTFCPPNVVLPECFQ